MISPILEQARAYEAEHRSACDAFRPAFHFTPAVGWCNDPNGFSVYDGSYHLFYQYYPYATVWGSMHWGHVKTEDFIRWTYLPAAMAPDTEQDQLGCFSGSAIEMDDGRQLLIYTGCYSGELTPVTGNYYQHQCIAVGDGIDYEKRPENPVIGADQIPSGHNGMDFRDPKIWKEDGYYYLVVSSQKKDTMGALLIYRSPDAYRCDFVSTLWENDGRYGTMLECPDFFSLDGHHILLSAPMEMKAMGAEFHPGHGNMAMIGRLDRTCYHFTEENVQAIDYGTDFYAPTTLQTPDGRRIMIAWLHNWAYKEYKMTDGPFFGQMILPRELFLREGRLCQLPVREIEKYYGRSWHREAMPDREHPVTAADMQADCRAYDMTLTCYISQAISDQPAKKSGFDLLLGSREGDHLLLSYDAQSEVLIVDRSAAGLRLDIVSQRSIPAAIRDGQLKLRLLVDRYSVECFLQDGRQAATFQVSSLDPGFSIEARYEIKVDIDIHEIKSLM